MHEEGQPDREGREVEEVDHRERKDGDPEPWNRGRVANPLLEVREQRRAFDRRDGGGARTFGFIGAAAGVGELIAAFTVSQLTVRRVGIYLYTVASVEGVAFFAIGLYPSLALVMVANALFAACVVAFTVVWDSLLQREVPRPLLGRVVSLDWFGALGLTPFGLIAAGAASSLASPGTIIAFGACISLSLVAFGLLSRQIREID